MSSYYDLDEVRRKIVSGDFLINANALRNAYDDFGWKMDDIATAYLALRPKHFLKTDVSVNARDRVMDFYRGRICGENIYTHFYIDDSIGKLVINSFKRR